MRSRVRQATRHVVERALGKRLLSRGSTACRRVALTFDDGPDDLTPRYLDLLARHHVPATFFVMGRYIDERPHMIAEYVRGGHQVAAHGYEHDAFTTLGPTQLRRELRRMSTAIGPRPEGRWVRPPYGAIGPVDAAIMWASGYVIALWSLDSKDHDRSAPEMIAARCGPDQVSPGEVMLFHEGQEETLAALPLVIENLREAGYELVTMADLFAT